MALNSHALNTSTLNGSSRSRFVQFSAQSEFTLTTQGRIGVRTTGEGQATFTISESAIGIRELRPLAQAYVRVLAANESFVHIHGFRSSSIFGFAPRQAIPDILISAGQQEAEFSFSTLKAQPLDEVFVARLGWATEDSSTRIARVFATSALDVSVEDSTAPTVIRQMSVDDQIRVHALAEPAINGEHEATAASKLKLFATSDEALVRSNSLGDASIKINALLDGSKVNMRHAGRVKSSFGLWSESGVFVNSMMTASSVFRVASILAKWFRSRISRANSGFGIRAVQETGRISRGMRGFSAVAITSTPPFGRRIAGGVATSNIAISSKATSTRIQRPTASAGFTVTSVRARALSNLTQHAADYRTFVVPEREFEFSLPAEEREFKVWY